MKTKEGWRVTKQFEFWKADTEKYRKFWTDGSPELKEGIEKLGAVHDTSVAGRPTNNSRIERLNRTILEGVWCILLDAGLPPQFWPYALRYYCLCLNVTPSEGDISAYEERFKEIFVPKWCQATTGGSMAIFGQRVGYYPQKTAKTPKDTAAPKAKMGIFLGYKPRSGGRVGDCALVANLNEFVTMNYHTGRRKRDGRIPSISEIPTKEILAPSVTPHFPLKTAYDIAYTTIEGLESDFHTAREHLDLQKFSEAEIRALLDELHGMELVPQEPDPTDCDLGETGDQVFLEPPETIPIANENGDIDASLDPFRSPPTPVPGEEMIEEGDDNNNDIDNIEEAPDTGGASSVHAPIPENQNNIWDRLQDWTRRDKKCTTFQSVRTTEGANGPRLDQVRARTTIDQFTGHMLESRKDVTGWTEEQMTQKLPPSTHGKHQNLITILHWDPTVGKKPKGMYIDGEWVRFKKGSNNPGIAAWMWKGYAGPQQDKLNELFKKEKRGRYAIDPSDPAMYGLKPEDDGKIGYVRRKYERKQVQRAAAAAAYRAAKRCIPNMPLYTSGNAIVGDGIHRDHIPALFPCFNPFLDKVTVYQGASPSDYGREEACKEAFGKQDFAQYEPCEADPTSGWYQPTNKAMVTRPIKKDELRQNKGAQAAVEQEWLRLRRMNTWVEDDVREWHEVSKEAKAAGETIHVGRLFLIIVEKNAELEVGNKNRKYKGRVVFQGNQVKDQNYEVAMFQDLGASPATMPASKAGDAYGCLPGHWSEQSDAPQAYTQALLKGKRTFVRLPREAWPKSWEKAGYRDPVCPLRLALYGHPDAGTYWEETCETHVLNVGFKKIDEWRSCYWHSHLRLLLVIYVDDFKLSGPRENLAKGWELIRNKTKITPGITLDPPEASNRYLGCEHIRYGPCKGKENLPNVEKAQKLRWQGDDPTTTSPSDRNIDVAGLRWCMVPFMKNCVETYCSLAGISKNSLPKAYTPFEVETGNDFGLGAENENKWTSTPKKKTTEIGFDTPIKTKPKNQHLDYIDQVATNYNKSHTLTYDEDAGGFAAAMAALESLLYRPQEETGLYPRQNLTEPGRTLRCSGSPGDVATVDSAQTLRRSGSAEETVVVKPKGKGKGKETIAIENTANGHNHFHWPMGTSNPYRQDETHWWVEMLQENEKEKEPYPSITNQAKQWESTKRFRPAAGVTLPPTTPKKATRTKPDPMRIGSDPNIIEIATGEPAGKLQPIAARVLMKILYGARMARYDLLRAVAGLARCVTRWTEQCDKDLHRLVCYINTTVHYEMISWVGDSPELLQLLMYCDADFAGDIRTQRSTSGAILFLQGPNTRFPQAAVSKIQTAVSHATTEAEMIAAAFGLRTEGIPFQILWDIILNESKKKGIRLTIAEDNEAMMKICKSGNITKLRHLSRTHRVNIAFVLERLNSDENIELVRVETNNMAADIYTKRFTDPKKWASLLYMNNIVDVDKFWKAPSYKTYIETTTKGAPYVSSYKGPTKEERLNAIKKASPAPILKALQRQRQADLNCTYDKNTIYDKAIRQEELSALKSLNRRIGQTMNIDANDIKIVEKELASIEWPNQARLNVRGQGTCLGLTNTPEGPRLGRYTAQTKTLSMTIGNIVRKLMVKNPWLHQFKWTSIQVNNNSIAQPHVDSGNVGLSLTMGFGDYTGGMFRTGDKDVDIKGKAVLVDGAVQHSSTDYTGNRYSIILFAHSAWKKGTD